jgi:hypothetical protein
MQKPGAPHARRDPADAVGLAAYQLDDCVSL